jgi:hypothetical protein
MEAIEKYAFQDTDQKTEQQAQLEALVTFIQTQNPSLFNRLLSEKKVFLESLFSLSLSKRPYERQLFGNALHFLLSLSFRLDHLEPSNYYIL